jgi:hypothetical protein
MYLYFFFQKGLKPSKFLNIGVAINGQSMTESVKHLYTEAACDAGQGTPTSVLTESPAR